MAYHYHYDNTIDSLSLKLPIGTGRLIHNHRNLAVKLIELWFCQYQYEYSYYYVYCDYSNR